MSSERRYILGIDILRLTAALLVLSFHLGYRAYTDPSGILYSPNPPRPFGWQITAMGWIGVQLFFVISGIVIAQSAPGFSGRPLAFLRARFWRLWPTVLLSASVALLVEVVIFSTPFRTAVRAWFRTVTFWPDPPWIMGQFWTLTIEVSFYFLISVILAFRPAFLSRIAWLLIVASSLYWAVRLANSGLDPIGRATQLLLLQHGCFFGLGLIIGSPRELYRLGLAIIVSSPTITLQIAFSAIWEDWPFETAIGWIWPVITFWGLTCLACLSVRFAKPLHKLSHPLKNAIRTAGLLTFPIYLLHNHIGLPILLLGRALALPSFNTQILAILLTALVSLWVLLCGEPFLRRLLPFALHRTSHRPFQQPHSHPSHGEKRDS
jgi:peptidoglycan/LPS O-acetylase OafA/YrhL